MALPGTP